jgi:excisionase family DNA binding protein
MPNELETAELLKKMCGELVAEIKAVAELRTTLLLENKTWLSVDEVYHYIDISESTLTKWVNRGLPFYQFGNGKRYFKRVEIDDFMQGLRKVEQTIDYNAEAANEQIKRIMRG